VIDLRGQVALVTGGSRGIGRAIAIALARAGADVALTYLNAPEEAQETAGQIDALGRRPIVLKADLSVAEDAANAVDVTVGELGRIDIAISNAAGGGFRPLLDVTPDGFDYAMALNARAFMILMQAAAPHLERGLGLPRSRAVSISSFGAERALPMYGAIGASKAALESLTRHFALELGPKGVNVNCVRAGVVDTASLRALPGAASVLEARKKRSLAADRNVTPEDVAGSVLFLVSALADMVQGTTLIVDGGVSLHE
jgi:enoyl-[acyl-carrier protein] reductase III